MAFCMRNNENSFELVVVPVFTRYCTVSIIVVQDSMLYTVLVRNFNKQANFALHSIFGRKNKEDKESSRTCNSHKHRLTQQYISWRPRINQSTVDWFQAAS